jgi:hypothetical protein
MKFLILDCDGAEEWQERPFSSMFRTLLEEPGEEWEVVKLDSGDPVPASLAITRA